MKFFLGSVPFGCDNIGDEAILESIVKIIRRNFDNPQICVATVRQSETSKLLNCETVGLLGFGLLDSDRQKTIESIKNADVYIWAGATGLSDYPEAGLVGLELAQKEGKKTVVWNVGMDNRFNPALFKIGGKKKCLCNIISRLSFNRVNFSKLWESLKLKMIEKRISNALSKCTVIALRDDESLARLRKFGSFKNAVVGADSALILDDYSDDDLNCLNRNAKRALFSDCEKIGVCVSSQRKIKDVDNFVNVFDKLLDVGNRKLFLIPMNDKTDLPLMEEMFANCKNKSDIFPLKGVCERRAVMAATSKCDVIVSSRLHLMILSSNVGTPIIGISRGSKIANFLRNFGRLPVGNVENFNFNILYDNINQEILEKNFFKQTSFYTHNRLIKKLKKCEKLLKDRLLS